jgi:AcrR family transcriptional regulator
MPQGSSPNQRSPRGDDARRRLLDGAVDYVAQHGVREHSLRDIAAALGTSHRMLIYHFGSKQGLFVEVIRAVEERQRQALAAFESDIESQGSTSDVMRQFWRRLADPSLWPHERLFFEVYGQALQGEPHALPLLEGIVDSWIEPVAELGRRRGMPPAAARASARLGLAVTRGLLLDLLATQDRRGVDRAMERYIEMYEASTQLDAARSRAQAQRRG